MEEFWPDLAAPPGAPPGYDFVAEALFSQLDVDGFFLEYTTSASAGSSNLLGLGGRHRECLGPAPLASRQGYRELSRVTGN